MQRHTRYSIVLMLVLFSATASAQTDPATMWRHGTTLNVFGGMARSIDTGPLAGGALGWEVTPRIAIEGSGTWFEWGHGSHGFGAAMLALVPLRRSRPVVPFLAGGAGLHRAWYEAADARMPEFYHRRISDRPGGFSGTTVFTDPSLVFGGGVALFVSPHIAIRPDVNATVVMRSSHARVMATAAVHLAYHFEDHPTALARSGNGRD